MARYVLDAFAGYAYFANEPGAPHVQELLEAAAIGEHELLMPMFTVGEVVYKIWRKSGADEASDALQIIEAWPLEIVHADRQLVLDAAELKAERRLGYLDCFPAALARQRQATVVTGDSDFRGVEDMVTVYWLPRA